MMRDLRVKLAGIELQNPVMDASGTFGSGMEYDEFLDLTKLGAIVTKGVSSVPWEGNGVPRIAETASGMLNAIGLQNPGVEVFLQKDYPFLLSKKVPIIVNVCGKTAEDYIDVVERLNETEVSLYEINISCPNVKEGGIAFGQNPESVYRITKAIKERSAKPVMMKLSPNVTNIAEMARMAEEGGADAVSLINTLTGMAIDAEKQCFILKNKTGGLSGPCIKPVALRMVYEVARSVKIPVVGMGGIETAADAIEFLLAGATAVMVGTANFYRPTAMHEVIRGIDSYMERHGIQSIEEFRGKLLSE